MSVVDIDLEHYNYLSILPFDRAWRNGFDLVMRDTVESAACSVKRRSSASGFLVAIVFRTGMLQLKAHTPSNTVDELDHDFREGGILLVPLGCCVV